MSYNNFDKVQYDSIDYYMRDTRNIIIIGTQSVDTNEWEGELPEGVDSYTIPEHLIIDYYLPHSGTKDGATLNLNKLGAKPVYASHGTTQITDEFEAYSMIRLAYVEDSALNNGQGAWKVVGSDASGSGAGGVVVKDTVGSASNWSSGTLPSLSKKVTDTSQFPQRITNFDAGTMTSIEASDGKLKITNGTVPTLTHPPVDVYSLLEFSQGTLPSLTVTSKTVVTDIKEEE